jgi:UDP-N-acetylmuramoyl-tripeptide--D-alanyl-D-alanine ligase
MTISIAVIIKILWLFSALFDYGEYCYRWQLKEYRWDRFKDFLDSNKGERFLFSYSVFWRGVIALLAFLFPFNSTLYLQYALILILGIDFSLNFAKLINRKVKRPVPTKKAISVILLTLVIEASVFLILGSWRLIFGLLIIRFLLLSFSVQLLNIPTKWIKLWYQSQAAKKLSQYSDLKVIGITGSYGKTSVKTYLSQLLEIDYNVVKTSENINTPIGVAKFILSHDFSTNDIFLVEMGAYQPGEIKVICDMVKPKIGILTGINEEHLSLFGSIEAIQQTKYELLRSVPNEGLVVTCADNKYCTEYLDELKANTIKTFGVDEINEPDFLIKQIESKQDKLYFSGKLEGNPIEITASVVGRHNAENLANSILTAQFLGVTLKTIKDKCLKLNVPDRRLTIRDYGRATIIDDSYNANPRGFKAALNVLDSFSSSKKHIVITRGMLELGKRSYEIHKEMGEEISFYADELIIISEDVEQPLKAGIMDKYRTKVKTIFEIEDLLNYVKDLYDSNSVVLIENRLPPKVYQEILNRSE